MRIRSKELRRVRKRKAESHKRRMHEEAQAQAAKRK